MIISVLHPFSLHAAASIFFYFTVYSFLGWLLENSYSFFMMEGFFKPNFLKGPFKPMYGIAPVLLIFLINEKTTWPVIIGLCFLIPALVEYIGGMMLQKIFHRQYWDYSDFPLQLHGHICLPFCICWILLSVICLQWIHPLMMTVYQTIETYWIWLYPAVMIYFLIELFVAIRKHAIPPFQETNSIP